MQKPLYSSKFFILFLFLLPAFYTEAQSTATITGNVITVDGTPLQGVSIRIPQLKRVAVTNIKGSFTLGNIPAGKYTVYASFVGYKEGVKTVDCTQATQQSILFTLEEDNGQLAEVTIKAKTNTQQAREQPIKAEIINAKAVQEQPGTLVELMNRSTGVRIRQTGGLGSNSNLMINGFQNRSIKYFKDGIPLDYLGAGYDISLVPVNMLDRVEVYKGVLPTSLGADALGGALNLVTKQSYSKYLELSYEMASFNTHRVSFNTLYKNEQKHFFAGADAFYNYSDNNYLIDNPSLTTPSEDKVRLFHNQFKNYYTELYGGISKTSWADEFRIGITGFRIDRQDQFGSRMTQPFGAATSSQHAVIPTVRYKKSFLNQKLFIDQFFVANKLYTNQIDTAKGQYDWYGNFEPSPSRTGELSSRGSLSELTYSYFTSRSNLSYHFNPEYRLDFNAVFTRFGRVGHDPLGLTFQSTGRDVLSTPAHYNKMILALGLESAYFNGRLVNNTMVKYYSYQTRATGATWDGVEETANNENSRWGIAEALKFSLTDRSFLRASAEIALRLPERDELFGDGNLQLPNFALKPEHSFNTNLGYRIEKPLKYALELNSFYRITKDLIKLQSPYNFMYSQSQNIQQVKGYGLEADATVSLLKWLKVNGNFTYQNLRLFGTNNPTTEDARLNNTPYFFANAGLNASFNHILNRKDKLQPFVYYSFVRLYYLNLIPKVAEPEGFLGLWGKPLFNAPNVIPNQHVCSAGFTYNPLNNGFSIGFQIRNIFDTPVYDNFKIQNAGRSFHLKLNYTLK